MAALSEATRGELDIAGRRSDYVEDTSLVEQINALEPTADNVRLAVKWLGGKSAVEGALRGVMWLDGHTIKPRIEVSNGEKAMRVTARSVDTEGRDWIHDMPVDDRGPNRLSQGMRSLLGKLTYLPPEDYHEVCDNFFSDEE